MTDRPTMSADQQRAMYGRINTAPVVDGELCTGCGKCKKECPTHIFQIKAKKSTVVGADQCVGCGHCWAVCPERAVTQKESAAPEEADFPEEPTVTADDLEVFLAQRRSVRRFKKEEIPRDVLERVVAAGSYAPTGSNKQNVGLVVVHTPERVAELRTLVEEFLLGFFRKLETNPFFAHIVAWKAGRDTAISLGAYADRLRWMIDTGRKSPYFALPFGAAVILSHCDSKDGVGHINAVGTLQSCAMMAQAEGLGSCYLGFVIFAANRDKRTKELLGIPEGHTCHAAVVLGYPDAEYLRPVKRFGPSVQWL